MRKAVLVHTQRHAIAYLALFIALGGTAYAATLPRNSVGTAQLREGAVRAEDVGRLPAASAFTHDFDQRFSDGKWAAVRLEQEAFDTARMHSAGNEDTRLVAPRAGTYVVEGAAIFEAGCCGSHVAEVTLTRASGGSTGIDRTNAPNGSNRAHVSGIVRMRAGDYLELIALQTGLPTVGIGGELSAAFVGG